MDIFKLLSRSTKQSNKAESIRNAQLVKLPSAGTTANPQLFHDAIPGSAGKKRKRGSEKAEEVEEFEVEDDEVDFFATKKPTLNPKKQASSDQVQGDHEAIQLLDSEECRQILRSHRLKVTLLSVGRAQDKKVKKSKKAKKAKKAKMVVATSSKDERKQLYPQPLQAFSELRSAYHISNRMAENLAEQGYKIPTEVQMGSLPLLLQPETALGEEAVEFGGSDIDLLTVAPTGSGKTLAFLIPIVNQIIQRRRTADDKSQHVLEAVVVAPTKELASQIVNEAKKLSLGTGVKIVGMRKGMRITDEVGEGGIDGSSDNDSEDEGDDNEKEKSNQPRVKADILVTTPGHLLSAIAIPGSSSHNPLPTVKTLVLDEADVLLDALFRDQTLGIWDSCAHSSLRVTLWSATMGSNIEAFASSTISSRCSRLSLLPRPLIRLIVGLKDSALPTIKHTLTYTATEPGKLLALRQLLHPTSSSTTGLRPPFLVFTQTIERAIALHSELLYDIPTSAGGSSRLAVLHSNLSDPARSTIMARFRSGEIWVLITTDILSRGIDFRGVNGVVNYDVPNSGAAYIHRVGRTGRAGREGGVAVTFYTKEDITDGDVKGIANIIAASEKAAGRAGEGGVQKWLLDALPKSSKEQKKRLKSHGVEGRRSKSSSGAGKDGEGDGAGKGRGSGRGRGKMQISTKSGYERKVENRRKGAIEGSRRRAALESGGAEKGMPGGAGAGAGAGEDSEWGGLDD